MQRTLVLVSVGNTRTRVARAPGGELQPSRVLENSDPGAIAGAVQSAAGEADADGRVVIASVNSAVSDRIEQALRKEGIEAIRFGRDIPVPIASSLPDAGAIGVDRLLGALGAFARSQQACIIIDAGTAVTVDFVDGEGTFQGGAIAPGLRMMLRSLHEQTAALPKVDLNPELLPAGNGDQEERPGTPPFGKNTTQAMAIGVVNAVRGLAHTLIDSYAAYYGGYPRVIATGGDAPLLFAHPQDPLIEHIVPDLVLVGMLEAVKTIEQLESQADDSDHDESAGRRRP